MELNKLDEFYQKILKQQYYMGSCNPKSQPQTPPQKDAVELICKRLRYHFQLKQNKINQEIISGQSFLVRKISEPKDRRDRVQQLLLAQRIVNGLKYSAVYTLLLEYAASVGNFANFICENIKNEEKLEPWKHKLYSLLYAAQKIQLSTLEDFKRAMSSLHNEIFIEQYADKQVKTYLAPHPTPQEMNIYFLEMSQRNNIPLEKINQVGHEFSTNFRPKNPDPQFQNKSKQYRDSLPKQQLLGNNFNNGKTSFKPRGSVSNPFDNNKPIETDPKKGDSSSQASGDKVDNNDISPNITDMMKKIGSSKS